MAHINHVTYWRGGGFTVETVDDHELNGNERLARTAPMSVHRRAIALHEAVRREPAVLRSVVLLVQQDGRGAAGVLAAYPTAGAHG